MFHVKAKSLETNTSGEPQRVPSGERPRLPHLSTVEACLDDTSHPFWFLPYEISYKQ